MRFLAAAVTIIGLGALSPKGGLTEELVPAKYAGTYRVDRWGQHRFCDGLFVSPHLHETFKPYAHLSAVADVRRIFQGSSPGAGIITEVGRIDRRPAPIAVSIAWSEPPDRADQRLLRIPQTGSVAVVVTVANRSDEPAKVAGAELVVSRHHNSADDFYDSPHMRCPLPVPSPRAGWYADFLSYTSQAVRIPWDDLRVSVADLFASPSDDGPANPPGLPLAPGDAISWTIRLEDWKPNEYEFAVRAWTNAFPKNTGGDASSWSDWLRVDVVEEMPGVARLGGGAELTLKWLPSRTPSDRRTVQVALRALPGRRMSFGPDLSVADPWVLFCYDAAGTLIEIAVPDRPLSAGAARFELEPGEEYLATARVPAETMFIRAYFARVALENSEDLVGASGVLSAHLK